MEFGSFSLAAKKLKDNLAKTTENRKEKNGIRPTDDEQSEFYKAKTESIKEILEDPRVNQGMIENMAT